MRKYIITIISYIFVITIGVEILTPLIECFTSDFNAIKVFRNFISYLILLVFISFLLKQDIKNDFNLFKTRQFKAKSVASGYLFILFGNYLSGLILTLLGKGGQTSQNQEGINQLLNSKYMIFMLLSVLFIPIIEELVFRKSFFGLLNKFDFNKKLILITSSLAFGLIHVIFNLSFGYDELIMGIPYVISGLVLGYIYLTSNENIYTVTIVHILNNLIASLLILFVI